MPWPRPVPLVGDQTSALDRAADLTGWAFPEESRQSLYDIIAARRDVRRFRPDVVDEDVLRRVLGAAHAAPSVGHSQPWRFIVVTAAETRERASRMADEQRLRQAAQMAPESARRLLDLQLDGIREAPLGVVVACDRRTPAAAILGRASFPDADLWSCACAIQNLWLAARAEGLGLGWVTLFDPDELAELLGLPEGVATLGWLCLGWPDERPPAPGLERAGWSRRQPLHEVVLRERWSGDAFDGATKTCPSPAPPPSHLRAPAQTEVVAARDHADSLLTPSSSLGLLDRYLDKLEAAQHRRQSHTGELILVAGRHPVVAHGVSAFPQAVTDDVLAASAAGESAGAVAARAAGLHFRIVDAGSSTGDLLHSDALSDEAAQDLLALGRKIGGRAGRAHSLVALGEVGIGNTTVAAALTGALLGLSAEEVVGLGAGADSAMLEAKRQVVASALARARKIHPSTLTDPRVALAAVGGPEFCVMAGLVLGAAEAGAVIVLDGLATSVSALAALAMEPGVAAYLIAGQRSRERGHVAVLQYLGLEPMLDLRLRAGEGVGAALACRVLLAAVRVRRETGRTR